MDSVIAPKTLYVVATPIGHLGDLSPRAREVLASVQFIAAEDTRHSQGLLTHLGIQTPMIALHEHNERQQSRHIVEALQSGACVALISDAGTPGISDPGARLVEEVHEAGLFVRTVPGPSALTAAISVSGLAAPPLSFHGFLPPKSKARQDALHALRNASGTHIFYEAPHRIVEMLEDMAMIFPEDRILTLTRELTKRFETVKRARIGEILAWVKADRDQQKGEFVLVLSGASPEEAEAARDNQGWILAERLAETLPLSEAARLAAELSHAKRSALYQRLLRQSEPSD